MSMPHRSSIADLKAAIARHGSPTAMPPEKLATGFASLDRALSGGLVRAALNEICIAEPGTGIAEALLPALHRLASQAQDRGDAPRLLAWIHPCKTPYPPALAQAAENACRIRPSGDRPKHDFLPHDLLHRWLIVRPAGQDDHLWAIEQALRSRACDAVVAHLGDCPDLALRRLQLAAEEGQSLGLLFRPGAMAAKTSPSAIRLMVRPLTTPSPRRRRLAIEVLRCRGVAWVPPLALEWDLDSLDECVVAAPSERATDAGAAVGLRRAAGSFGA